MNTNRRRLDHIIAELIREAKTQGVEEFVQSVSRQINAASTTATPTRRRRRSYRARAMHPAQTTQQATAPQQARRRPGRPTNAELAAQGHLPPKRRGRKPARTATVHASVPNGATSEHAATTV